MKPGLAFIADFEKALIKYDENSYINAWTVYILQNILCNGLKFCIVTPGVK